MDAKAEKFLEYLAPLKPALAAYVRRLLWNRNDFDDALQSILAEAYGKFGGFEPGTSFKAWVFRIATLTVFNMNRKYQKESGIYKSIGGESDFPAPEQISQPDYRKMLDGRDLVLEGMSDRVKSSLSALSEPERSVFLLRSLAGFNYDEIARTLEMPAGTVMSHLARSRAKLRSRLAGYFKESGAI